MIDIPIKGMPSDPTERELLARRNKKYRKRLVANGEAPPDNMSAEDAERTEIQIIRREGVRGAPRFEMIDGKKFQTYPDQLGDIYSCELPQHDRGRYCDGNWHHGRAYSRLYDKWIWRGYELCPQRQDVPAVAGVLNQKKKGGKSWPES